MLALMTPPLSLVERKQRQARQRIIEAARELFLERGFDGVSVGDIAERAEVGRTTFFRHFGDKQEVVFANEQELLDTITAATQADGSPAPRGATEAVEQLRPVVLALCAQATVSPEATARFAAQIAIACYQTAKSLGNAPRTLADETEAAFGRALTLGTGTAQT